jgi:type IV secretion system protein TrbI
MTALETKDPPAESVNAEPAPEPAPPEPQAPPRSAQDITKELRLHHDLPLVAKLSRKAAMSLACCGAVAIGAIVAFGLQSRDAVVTQEQINTGNVARTDAVNVLPADYSKFPLLGPPLPGDFGRPILNGTAGRAPLGDGTVVPAPAQPDPRIAQVAQERDAARTSQLFSGAELSRQGSSAGDTPAEPPRLLAATNNPDGEATPAPSQPSLASRRNAFLAAPTDHRTTSPDRLSAPPGSHILQAGSVIAAALVTGIRSDIPGQVTAQVTQNVYDSVKGVHLLIPQGSKLIGQYDADISFGQSRALLVWNRLILPDGRSIILERLPAADPQGYAGLEDRVNYHWGRVAKAAILSTVLGIGAELGNSSSNDIARAIREGTQGTLNQAGQQIVSRQLDVPPTITIRPGTPVRVMVVRDLILGDDGD